MRILLLFACLALLWIYRFFPGGAIDGTLWEVKVRPDVFFALSRRDTLLFQNGRMTSLKFASEGFLPARYKMTSFQEEKSGSWNVVFDRAKQETVEWRGAVEGDRMRGLVLWRRPDGKVRRFTFRGVRKPT
ncbi:MAG: hypothetical protein HY551_06645 [Elusimicrobia bacterium]|nr:hypothetical protein [Elusimicrobiota bacterium]